MPELEKTYTAKNYEEKIYSTWNKGGFFKPEINPKGKPFGVVMPPPNITGGLHLGHALCNDIKDVIIRFRRMKGEKVLFLPGTDHAGIATQAVVEKELAKEGKSRHDLGRDKFVERVWEWKKKYGSQITEQLKRLGISCDWTRERFTLSPELNKVVNKVFVELYDKGLIYRGEYLVNWCTRCGTAISDLEVIYKEEPGKLWEIKYPIKGKFHKFVTVSTTRPETMLGDTAVAVNPKDKRYEKLVGQTLILPLMKREIPIIADELVDPEFGTGAVKVTPAHDPNDFEIGQRHKLESVKIIGEDGKMTKEAGEFKDLSLEKAREKVLEALKKEHRLGKVLDYAHSVGHCQRCGEIVEPLISKQWFVKMKSLAKPATDVVKQGKIIIQPKSFEKIYFQWLENIHDWCISRQLWWGHQLPVYYCSKCDSHKEHPVVKIAEAAKCSKCDGKLERDPDVLDTWFSSALWPFSTLGWPEKTKDYEDFYPNSLMQNGRDIIFFWDVRMIVMGLYLTKQIPFKHLYLHGMVLDKKGRKMSKSLGNGIDPIAMIDKYGADALRMALIVGLKPGNDMRMYEEKIKGYRNFINKVWNISRFVLTKTNDSDYNIKYLKINKNLFGDWILPKLQRLIKDITKNLENYEISEAGEKLYDFIWKDFADWTLFPVYGSFGNKKQKCTILRYVLREILKLSHPFIPFVTEVIWGQLNTENKLIISKWPSANQKLIDQKAENEVELIRSLVTKIRNARVEQSIKSNQEIEIRIETSKNNQSVISAQKDIICKLARVKKITYGLTKPTWSRMGSGKEGVAIFSGGSFVILNADLSISAEKRNNEVKKLENYIQSLKAKLANKDFITRAPREVVEKEGKKLNEAEEKLKRLI